MLDLQGGFFSIGKCIYNLLRTREECNRKGFKLNAMSPFLMAKTYLLQLANCTARPYNCANSFFVTRMVFPLSVTLLECTYFTTKTSSNLSFINVMYPLIPKSTFSAVSNQTQLNIEVPAGKSLC